MLNYGNKLRYRKKMKSKPLILTLTKNQGLVRVLQDRYQVITIDLNLDVDNLSEDAVKRVLKDVTPDLIIVDLRRPSAEKFKVSLGIRRSCDIPLLMLSSWNTKGNMIRRINIKAADGLSEPVDGQSLLTQIDNIFLRARIHRN